MILTILAVLCYCVIMVESVTVQFSVAFWFSKGRLPREYEVITKLIVGICFILILWAYFALCRKGIQKQLLQKWLVKVIHWLSKLNIIPLLFYLPFVLTDMTVLIYSSVHVFSMIQGQSLGKPRQSINTE